MVARVEEGGTGASVIVANKAYDPTEGSQAAGSGRMVKLIKAAYPGSTWKDAVQAYDGLRDDIPGMSQPVSVTGR